MTRKKTIREKLPSPGRIRIGDVLAIPLGDDFWGYVRSIRGAGFAILNSKSKGAILQIEELIGQSPLDYIAYCEPWDYPNWVYVGKWPLERADDGCSPAEYSLDVLDPSILIIHRNGNVSRTSDPKEIEGLKLHEGMLMPGNLVVKIRGIFDLPVDKKLIEQFAPFTSNWTPPSS